MTLEDILALLQQQGGGSSSGVSTAASVPQSSLAPPGVGSLISAGQGVADNLTGAQPSGLGSEIGQLFGILPGLLG